jgi:hypothetical protein
MATLLPGKLDVGMKGPVTETGRGEEFYLFSFLQQQQRHIVQDKIETTMVINGLWVWEGNVGCCSKSILFVENILKDWISVIDALGCTSLAARE